MHKQIIMIQDATSDAGKLILMAGLCRVLVAGKGIKVTPFKPQNMTLNSAVTEDGDEIGRAQALQAQTGGVQHPILLKPSIDTGTQLMVHGKAVSALEAACT